MAESKQTGSQEESLTTLLTPLQRTDLTLLLAAATAKMRESIEAVFDASATSKPDVVTDLTSRVDQASDANPNLDPNAANEEEEEKRRNALKERERELSAPKMKELREAALQFFDEWRTGLMGRVGEVVNSRGKTSEQAQQAHVRATTGPMHSTDHKLEANELDTSIDVDAAFRSLYPPTPTPLSKLDEPKRLFILHSMLLILLSLEHYLAPSRVLLLHLTSSLRLPLSTLANDEENTAKSLITAAKQMSGSDETKQKAEQNSSLRAWKVGLASVAGAAVIGITGGLAAPLVAAGVGSVMGGLGLGATAAAGYLGTVAGSTVIVGGLFGAYGGKMTGKMMDAYAKEVSDFAFLPVRTPAGGKKHLIRRHADDEEAGKAEAANRRLRVTVGISGWLTEKEEVVTPWRVIGQGTEVFALRFELEALLNLGNSIQTMVSSYAWGYAKKEIIKRTIFAEMMAALWPIGLLKISKVVDNPFSVAKARADKAGEVLADALINRCQGERPVTLIGYSLGARVIYTCCLSLTKRKAFGLIESIVLMGAPTPSDSASWRLVRSVVSGRCVNVWSGNDYVLGFLYRTSSIQFGVAGMQAVEGVAGIENVDVSEVVSGHLRYRYLVGVILTRVGFEDVEMSEIIKEEETLRALDEEEAKKKQSESDHVDADEEAAAMEEKVQAKTQMSLMQRGVELLSLGGGGGKDKEEHDSASRGQASHDGKTIQPAADKSYLQMGADTASALDPRKLWS